MLLFQKIIVVNMMFQTDKIQKLCSKLRYTGLGAGQAGWLAGLVQGVPVKVPFCFPILLILNLKNKI